MRFGFEVQQQPQRFEGAGIVDQMRFVDRHHRVLAFRQIMRQELLDAAHRLFDILRLAVGRLGQLIGQIRQQRGGRHLWKHQLHERAILFGQVPPQLLHQQRLAAACRAAQQGRPLAIFDGIAQLEHRPLMAFAGVIAVRVADVFKRPPLELPIRFVHGMSGLILTPRPEAGAKQTID